MGIRFQDGMLRLIVGNRSERDWLRIQERRARTLRLRTWSHAFALLVALIGLAVMLAWPAFSAPQISESPVYRVVGTLVLSCSQKPSGIRCHKVRRTAPSKVQR